jgi:uncharacterized SAM-binding protein YcdF (DUF218 family)
MFFSLSKILAFFLDPCFYIAVLTAAAVLCVRRGRFVKAAVVALAVYIFIVCFTPFAAVLTIKLEDKFKPVTTPLPMSAAVVLSGSTLEFSNQTGQYDWGVAVDRIMEAIRLYRAGDVEWLIISGGTPYKRTDILDESPSMKKIALEWGVPENRIILDTDSLNTRENAVFCKRIIEAKGLQDFYLVTSALHMRRAMAAFVKEGMKPTPYPVDFQLGTAGWRRYLVWGTPALDLFRASLHEIVGYWVYQGVGYL